MKKNIILFEITESVVTFCGIQDVRFLPTECKSYSKETERNTDQPSDTSCKCQESCLL